MSLTYLTSFATSFVWALIYKKWSMQTIMAISTILFSQLTLALAVAAYRGLIKEENRKEDVLGWLIADQSFVMWYLALASIASGVSMTLSWSVNAHYVFSISDPNNRGFFFGVSWFITYQSQIIGNWFGAQLITETSGPGFFLTLFAVQIVPLIGFFFIRIPKEHEPLIEEEKELTAWELVVQTVRFSKSHEVRKLVLIYCWSGTETAFFFGILTPFMVLLQTQTPETADLDDAHSEGNALFAFIYLGIGEVLAGVAIGTFADKLSNRTMLLFQAALVVLIFSMIIHNLNTGQFGTLTYLVCFLCGFGDGIYTSYCNKL